MLDTLKLTKRVEDAGLERRRAEATVETVATKRDLRELGTALRTELKTETQALRTAMANLAQNLRTETEALAQNLRTEMAATTQNLRTEMPTLRWQVIAAVGLMLLVHLGAVWGIVAAHAP